MEIKNYTLTSYYSEKYRSATTLDKCGKEIENIFYENEVHLSYTTLSTYNGKGLLEAITSKDFKYELLNSSTRYEYIEFDKKGTIGLKNLNLKMVQTLLNI